MSKQVRYRGEFLSRAGVVWRVDIWQMLPDGETFAGVGELTFPADEPVLIEWNEKGKEEVVCGSSATVVVESPGDRTYADLYTEKPGEIGVDIYKGGATYWIGTLDPEQYEEPYERASCYDVTLCFQDFGILSRLRYSLSGIQSMGDVLRHALGRAQMGGVALDASTLVTSYLSGAKATVDAMSVLSDNFYDEDGEASTLLEVVEGMLRPLGQRMVQRNGKIWLYDLNGLSTLGVPREIVWSGDCQTMGVDRVFNNVKLTFSPYAEGTLLEPDEVEYTDDVDETATNLTNQEAAETGFWSFFPDYGDWGGFGDSDASGLSFTIHKGHGKGLAHVHHDTGFFRIVNQGGGSDAEGVAWMFYTGGHGSLNSGKPRMVGHDPGWISMEVMRTRRVFIPPVNETEETLHGFGGSGNNGGGSNVRPVSDRWLLRLKMEILCDPRYNPFTESGGDNEGSNYDHVKEYVNWLYVPCDLRLWDSPEGGSVLWHYSNREVASRNTHVGKLIYLKRALGGWVQGDQASHSSAKAGCWLAWYDETAEERWHATGVLGWQSNRHQIGADGGELSAELKNAEDGQYIPYPPCGGWLEVRVWSSISSIDDTSPLSRTGGIENLENSLLLDDDGDKARLRWLLYKAPTLEVVSAFATHEIANSDDIEHTAWVNPDAEEGLDIDTICGTMEKLVPTAKGVILVNSTGERLLEMTRAGRTDRPERLLMGSLYSQFATRHIKLSGEAYLDTGDLTCFTEANQNDRVFIMTGEVQNLIEDTSEATLVELSPDEYDAEIFDD